MCGFRLQKPPQPINSHYPCSLALFVFKDQARGQRLIRSSLQMITFLLSHLIRSNKPSLLNIFLVLATLGVA
ncbi:unnamed protein product [Hymenolepis diminuta]|uniref:Uncharacterized protein n=1 Tax=Hymenolepis diminuta TaxID=6216 RepID=A0A564YYP8_HYMDI|nr:unnamed protein product [Hymenolepis diminuta]